MTNRLREVPAAVTLLAVLSVIFSAAREWAYYRVIGTEFILFNSPADYARISIHWLPMFVLAAMTIVVLEMFLLRTEGFRSEKEIVQRAPEPRVTRLFRLLPGVLFLVAIGLGCVHLLLMLLIGSPKAIDWLTPAGGFWLVFSTWFTSHPHICSKLAKTGRRLLRLGPIMAALVIGHGYDEALRDLALPHGEYRVVHVDDSVEDNVQLLRATSAGILILRVSSRGVAFLANESFKSIERTTGH